MSKRIIFQSAGWSNRSLQPWHSYPQTGTRLGEAVGGTAAVCCCFSFGLPKMMYLAVYKVPARLCQKALRRRRQRRSLTEEELMPARWRCSCGCCDDIIGGGRVYPLCCDDDDVAVGRSAAKDEDVAELEKEMWERFYGSGFWRSPSQRDHNDHLFSFHEGMLTGVSSHNLQVIAAK